MQERPVSVTIFGILNIGFALFGLLSLVVSKLFLAQAESLSSSPIMKQMYSNPTYIGWMKISAQVNGVVMTVLLAAGVGLLLMQNWARVTSIGYGIYGIISAMVNSVVMFKVLGPLISQSANGVQGFVIIGALIGAGFGLIFGLAYPVLLIIFMTRPKIVAAFGPAQPLPVT